MTLQGAIQELYEMREDTSLPVYYALLLEDVINTLRADVQEVRHGRWEDLHCTVCGKVGWSDEDAYCPNCGAKMDEVDE